MTQILYFGRLSDLTGTSQEALDLPEHIKTTGELRLWLDQRFSANGALLEPSVRIALNNQFVFDQELIVGASEVAFMPPVGGG